MLEEIFFEYIRHYVRLSLNDGPALALSILDEAWEVSKAAMPSARAIPDKRRTRIVRPLLETQPARSSGERTGRCFSG
eukprot:scaffold11655_cov133-Skeletonema_marinoi.AAC.6